MRQRERQIFAPILYCTCMGLVLIWIGWMVATTATVSDPIRHLVSLLGVALVGGGVGWLLRCEDKRARRRPSKLRLKAEPKQHIDTRV